ncbi:MAG: hypothetical protein RIB67_04085 [Miltoncostaeaceae bacterium]
MAEEQLTKLAAGDKVRHRDVGEDGPIGTVVKYHGATADGAGIYQVAYRSRTGSRQLMRYPIASLVLVERAQAE